MKRSIYLFTIALLALTFTLSTSAHAAKKKKATTLPINTNVVYLVIAGLAIGVVAVRKSKQAEADVI